MTCENILIVYFREDEETKDVKDRLIEKYKADRSVNTYKLSHEGEGTPCIVPEKPESEKKKGKTGIYVIHHGYDGFTRGLALEGVRTAFVEWLLLLADHHEIRKLCFIACTVVETDTKKEKASPVSAESAEEKERIYLQQICHKISEIDTKGKLNGLMVAGYTSGVSVVKEPNADNPRIFKSTQKDNPDLPMRPASMRDLKIKPEPRRKIVAYMKHKRVFVLEGGKWRAGGLWEYTDKDAAWQKVWKEQLEHWMGSANLA
jgi:hypothetical protein